MVEVIVARHGESEYSAVGRVNGDPAVPCPLTDQGRDEARAFGRTLDGVPIDLCVTSEFRRTKETADLALEGRDVVRLVLPDLNDLAAGDFEGEPLGDLRAWLRRHGPLAELPGGGEPRVATVRRYARAFRTLLARDERTILVVAHGLAVTYAVRAARGLDLPLSLEGTQVGHVQPHHLTAPALACAAERLEAYADDPHVAGSPK